LSLLKNSVVDQSLKSIIVNSVSVPSCAQKYVCSL